jgi:hypothetical protein
VRELPTRLKQIYKLSRSRCSPTATTHLIRFGQTAICQPFSVHFLYRRYLSSDKHPSGSISRHISYIGGICQMTNIHRSAFLGTFFTKAVSVNWQPSICQAFSVHLPWYLSLTDSLSLNIWHCVCQLTACPMFVGPFVILSAICLDSGFRHPIHNRSLSRKKVENLVSR